MHFLRFWTKKNEKKQVKRCIFIRIINKRCIFINITSFEPNKIEKSREEEHFSKFTTFSKKKKKNYKKTQKNQKTQKKTKNQKKTLGWAFLKKNGFIPTLINIVFCSRGQLQQQQMLPTQLAEQTYSRCRKTTIWTF